MSDEEKLELVQRIKDLEVEVQERELDLKRFRDELGQVNARLTKMLERFKSDLNLLQVMQKILVPTEFPHIAGFEFSTRFVPSSVAGGDYFDIFEHDDRARFGIIVSSASGHSMSALLLGVLLKMTSQLEARRGSEPHQVVQEMYKQLEEHLTPEDQSDIFYAFIDRRNFELKYILAGEMVALHQNSSTGEVVALHSGLGPVERGFVGPAESAGVLLNPRDRVVLCTRGVTEMRNAKGEAYGLERVTRSFLNGPKRGVHELRNHILYELNHFVEAAEPQRDQTLVVLEVKDKVIKLAKG